MADRGTIPPDDIPRSPTGRVPKWVIDQAQGRISEPEPWRGTSAQQTEFQSRQTKKRRSKNWIPLLVILAIAASSLWIRSNSSLSPTSAGVLIGTPAASTSPTPGYEESKHPLGTPQPPPVTSNSFRFVMLQSDNKTPVAYDPCRPIHFVIRAQGEPPGGKQLILGSFAELSLVTGLQFIYDGDTSESPSTQRNAFQPARYGDHWAPVLITWDTVAEVPDFATTVEGRAGSAAVSQSNQPKIYVTGSVELASEKLSYLMQSPGGYEMVQSILLHELGHLVGLAHVADVSQLMFPEAGHGVIDFAAGDLTGLAKLGGGSCAPYL